MILFEQTTEASFVFHSDGRCPDRHMDPHPKLQTSECATLAVAHAIPSFKNYLTYPIIINEYRQC